MQLLLIPIFCLIPFVSCAVIYVAKRHSKSNYQSQLVSVCYNVISVEMREEAIPLAI